MSEIGIATAAIDKIVLAVISHLNEGNIEDAVAIFADQFSFQDHGIQLEFNTKESLTEFFRKARELLLGYAAADRHHVCERRPSPYRMDA